MGANRSRHQRCSIKKAVLKNFVKFTGKQCCSPFLIKLQTFKFEALLKKTLQHRFFAVNTAKFLRKTFLKNICERLFLNIEIDIYHK